MADQPIPCPKCQFPNAAHAKFCNSCGTALGVKCRSCWASNDLGAVFCQECGQALKDAKFGLPASIANEWGKAFEAFKWPRLPGEKSSEWLRKLSDPFNPGREVVVFLDVIQNGGWVQKVIASGRVIGKEYMDFSARPKFLRPKLDPWGCVVCTNRRLCILDYSDWVISYPFEDLVSAKCDRVSRPKCPIFDFDFGHHGKVEFWRREMWQAWQPGAVASFFINSSNITQVLSDVENTKKNADNDARENALLVSYFEDVILKRQQFGG